MEPLFLFCVVGHYVVAWGWERGRLFDPHVTRAVVVLGGIHVGDAAYEGVRVVDHEG